MIGIETEIEIEIGLRSSKAIRRCKLSCLKRSLVGPWMARVVSIHYVSTATIVIIKRTEIQGAAIVQHKSTTIHLGRVRVAVRVAVTVTVRVMVRGKVWLPREG